jgi:hypothetical protein
MKKYLLPALLAALLAGCGGGGGSNNNTPAPVAVDAFTALVASDYQDQSDTADVKQIDTVAVTSPETTEPTAI